MLTVVGLGSAALIGGIELAAGVVVGAGLDAMLRRPRRLTGESAGSSAATGETHDMSERLASRARLVRERARAVVDAARGKPYAPSSEAPHGEASSPDASPRESARTDSMRYETPATD